MSKQYKALGLIQQPDFVEKKLDKQFEFGQVVVTQALWDELTESRIEQEAFGYMAAALYRHGSGDWGSLSVDDKAANDHAVKNAGRIFSAYWVDDVEFWVITEADRSVTTLLLPSDY